MTFPHTSGNLSAGQLAGGALLAASGLFSIPIRGRQGSAPIRARAFTTHDTQRAPMTPATQAGILCNGAQFQKFAAEQ